LILFWAKTPKANKKLSEISKKRYLIG